MGKILIFIILILCLGSIVITDNINSINPIIIDSDNPGPVLLMIGGTHGNEPAGTIGLEKFISTNVHISRGKIIIVPRVNKIGLELGIRYGFNGFVPIDFNRNYPTVLQESDSNSNSNTSTNINGQIIKLVGISDFVLDIHESWGWSITNPESLGSGLYPSDTNESKSIGLTIVKRINQTIIDNKKKFTFSAKHKEIEGTLYLYCKNTNKNYLLVEITGQNNIQPIELRVDQVIFIINILLEKLNMV